MPYQQNSLGKVHEPPLRQYRKSIQCYTLYQILESSPQAAKVLQEGEQGPFLSRYCGCIAQVYTLKYSGRDCLSHCKQSLEVGHRRIAFFEEHCYQQDLEKI